MRRITYEIPYALAYVVVLQRFEVFHSSPSRRFSIRELAIALPLLEAARNTMEDEVKKLLEVVNKLEPSLSDPVHSTELKLVS